MIRSVVVFPQPEGPSSVTNSPCCTLRLTPCSTPVSPKCFQYVPVPEWCRSWVLLFALRCVQPQLAMRGRAAGTRQAGCTYRYMLSINNFSHFRQRLFAQKTPLAAKSFLRRRRESCIIPPKWYKRAQRSCGWGLRCWGCYFPAAYGRIKTTAGGLAARTAGVQLQRQEPCGKVPEHAWVCRGAPHKKRKNRGCAYGKASYLGAGGYGRTVAEAAAGQFETAFFGRRSRLWRRPHAKDTQNLRANMPLHTRPSATMPCARSGCKG